MQCEGGMNRFDPIFFEYGGGGGGGDGVGLSNVFSCTALYNVYTWINCDEMNEMTRACAGLAHINSACINLKQNLMKIKWI